MNLTEQQRKVLGALELEADRGLDVVARELNMQHSNVQKVLAGLVAKNVIDGKTAIIDLTRLGLIEYGFMLSVDVKVDSQLEEALKYLLKQAAVSWIAEVGGAYEIMFNVVAGHPRDVALFFDRLTKQFPTLIRRKLGFVRTERLRYWRNYLLNRPRKGPGFHLGANPSLVNIDEKDRQLLASLSRMKHQSFRELAAEIDMPIATYLRRLKVLQQTGLLLGFGFRINLEALGIEQYRILLSASGDSAEWYRRLQKFCLQTGRIKLLTRTIGNVDFDLEVDVTSGREIKKLLFDLRELFPEESLTSEVLPIFRHRKFISFPPL